MATVTGLTAARMIEMENATVIAGEVVDGELILETRDGTLINAGIVEGPIGPSGGGFTICTSTTRPTFSVGEEGKAIYETDTDIWRIWNGTAFKIQERLIRTSTTRPTLTAGDEGVTLYETDTNLEYVWTGTSWMITSSYIARYADAAARSAAWPSPPLGALSALATHLGVVWIYESAGWTTVGNRAGTPSLWLGTTAPSDSVFMYGQTIANADTLYPACWANVAPNWKSGSSLLVPDMRDRIPIGKGDMGGSALNLVTNAVSGVNTLVLGTKAGSQYTQAHVHPMPHNHATGFGLFGGGFVDFGPGGQGTLNVTGDPSNPNTQPYGSGGNQNMPPVIVLNWILKIL